MIKNECSKFLCIKYILFRSQEAQDTALPDDDEDLWATIRSRRYLFTHLKKKRRYSSIYYFLFFVNGYLITFLCFSCNLYKCISNESADVASKIHCESVSWVTCCSILHVVWLRSSRQAFCTLSNIIRSFSAFQLFWFGLVPLIWEHDSWGKVLVHRCYD